MRGKLFNLISVYLRYPLVIAGVLFVYGIRAQNYSCDEYLKMSSKIYASDPDSSYILAIKAEELGSKNNDNHCIAFAKNYKSKYFLLKSRLTEANQELSQAEEIAREYNLKDIEAHTASLKSILLKRLKRTEEALAYLEKAKQINYELRDTSRIINNLTNLSLEYIELNRLEDAEKALAELKEFLPRMSENAAYYYYQNAGKYFLAKGKTREALAHLLPALEIASRLNMIDSKVSVMQIIGDCYAASGNFDKSLSIIKESIALCDTNLLIHEKSEGLFLLSSVFVKMGDYKNAFETINYFHELEDSILNIETISRINELEKRMEIAEKEKQLEIKNLALENEKMEKESASFRLNIVLVVLFVAIALMLLLVFNYRKIKSLNKVVADQKKVVEEKNDSLNEALRNVTDSIIYSKRLQDAIIPTKEYFKSSLPESFVFFCPKDIVSGDFYWLQKSDEEILFSVIDCTGHGVPGAMVSVVGYNALNRALKEFALKEPADILNKLQELVRETFSKGNETINDGMDISLVRFNPSSLKLKFAGANNSVWIIRTTEKENPELIELKADKQPVGNYSSHHSFSQKEIQLQKNDTVYLLTDGYSDQFGGEQKKKFRAANLKKLLISIQDNSMEEQNNIIRNTFFDWKGELEQIDDVTIAGFRV